MIKTGLRLTLLGALTAAIVIGLPDIRRYLGIQRLSGQPGRPGRPGSVPVAGRTVYPQVAASGAPDGTGDFDSASRGGPR